MLPPCSIVSYASASGKKLPSDVDFLITITSLSCVDILSLSIINVSVSPSPSSDNITAFGFPGTVDPSYSGSSILMPFLYTLYVTPLANGADNVNAIVDPSSWKISSSYVASYESQVVV